MYLDFNEFSNEQDMIFMFFILSTGEMNSKKTTTEFRSYVVPLPQAVMFDWTATATKEERDRISKLIGIIPLLDAAREKALCILLSGRLEDNLQWLIDELVTKQECTPKSIIYCRNIKPHSQIYPLFRRKILTQNSELLYAMFYHSTSEKNKNIVADTFGKFKYFSILGNVFNFFSLLPYCWMEQTHRKGSRLPNVLNCSQHMLKLLY